MKYDFAKTKKALKEIEEHLGRELSGIRAGRATPLILDTVTVDAYGSPMRIPHIANVSVLDARTLLIAPWDANHVKGIVAALAASQPGLSVSADSAGVRVTFPDLTNERRLALLKIAHEKLEAARVSARIERDKAWSDIQAKQKEGELSEDEKFAFKDELQKIIDEANASLKTKADKKEVEIKD
jgi:ribosome recycling factor